MAASPGKGKPDPKSGGYGSGGGIVVPAPKPKAGKGERAVFDQFIGKHTALRPYASRIWHWANYYGMGATQLAALIFYESGGDPDIPSNVGALGLAQIYDNAANPRNQKGDPFWRSNRHISDADKKNPDFAIRYAAWRMSGHIARYGGDFRAAYEDGYNSGLSRGSKEGAALMALLPKGYVYHQSGASPGESAARAVETSQAKAQLQPGQWAVIGDDGKVRYVKAATQPGGRSFDKDIFVRIWGQWNDIYQAYAGRNAKANEIGKIISRGWSEYTVSNLLSKKESFFQSPTWKSRAGQYQSIAKDIGVKAGRDMLRQAIVNNWSGESFAHKLRQLPGYLQSNEFKTTEAGLGNVYRSIFGEPDINAKTTIKEAALGGWTADQFAAELRARPEYQQSNEYLAKAGSFFSQLEGILGVRLGFQTAPTMTGGPFKAPDDKRVPGMAQPPTPNRLAPVLNA